MVCALILAPHHGRIVGLAFAWVTLATIAMRFGVVPSTMGSANILFGGLALIAAASGLQRDLSWRDRDLVCRTINRLDGGYVRIMYGAVVAMLMLVSLRRTAPSLACIAAAAALIAGWRLLPPRTRPFRAYGADLAVLAVTTTLSALVVEAVFRRWTPPSWGPIRYWQPDPRYNAISKPNTRGFVGIFGPAGAVEFFPFQFSSQGFRDREYGRKAIDEIRVLMLGDSYTMGHVPEQDSIPKQLERICSDRMPNLRISVINGGIGNTGPIEQLGMLVKRGLPVEPDIVVLQTFPGNDLGNCLAAQGRWLRPETDRVQANIQRWRRVVEGSVPFVVDNGMRTRSAVYNKIAATTKHGAPLAEYLRDFRFFAPVRPIELSPFEERSIILEPDLITWYPELVEAFDLFKQHILEMRDVCDRHGIAFRAYSLATEQDLYEKSWNAATAMTPALYERMKVGRLVDVFFDEAGIQRVSVNDAIVAAGPAETEFYAYDGHLRAAGNRAVAERLFEAVIVPFVTARDSEARNRAAH